MTEEILLGDYKFVLDDEVTHMYDIYLHNKKIGWVSFLDDSTVDLIYSSDTDLITMLLLRYQTTPKFEIHTDS